MHTNMRAGRLSLILWVSIAQILWGGGNASAAQPARAVPADALTPVRSPRGDFSILIPAGWRIKEVPNAVFATVISPPAANGLGIHIFLLPVSDLRYTSMLNQCTGRFARNPLFAPNMISGCIVPAVRAQLADSSHAWAPMDALKATLQLFSGNARFQILSASAASQSQFQYRVLSRANGREAVHFGSISMSYLANPLLSQAGAGVTSLAFITGCSAPPDRESDFRARCAAVLRSFRPESSWGGQIAQTFTQSYNDEFQTLVRIGQSAANNFGTTRNMIGNFGASMQRMQSETYQAIEQAQYKTQRDWIAAFAGQTIVRNPNTGDEYSVPAGYSSYCLDAAGNTVLAGNDIHRGQWLTNASRSCETQLQQP